MFNVGDAVRHRVFGEGKVVGIENRGLFLVIQYEKTLGIARSSEVSKVDKDSEPRVELDKVESKSVVQPQNVPIPNTVDTSSRSMTEAFRLGIVPYGAVRDFTFGRDKEIRTIKKWLNSDSEGTLIIRSGYGSGKSHLLDYINVLALDNHYAVVSAEFDQETPPYRPKLIYQQFIKSFRLKNNGADLSFRDFIKKVGHNQRTIDSSNGYLNRAVRLIDSYPEDEEIWDWIEGKRIDGVIRPRLYDNGTASNIYCHIISEIASGVRNELGMKGIVVTLDEAERVTNATNLQNIKGWHFVRGLTMLATNDQRLRSEKIVFNWTPEGKYFGENTKLLYSGFEPNLRYCADLPSFVKVIFAFTDGNYEMENWLNKWQINHIPMKLETLPESAFRDIFYHIYKLYNSSYKFKLADDILERVYHVIKEKTEDHNVVIRYFIKATVEVFDILRYHPELSPEEIE